MRNLFATLLLFSLSTFYACSQNNKKENATTEKPAMELLNAKEFEARIKSEPGMIIDVRTASEQKKGMISGAKAMDIFSEDFEARVDQLDKTKTYYLYCASGGRSSEAAELMNKKGFSHVVDLDGGFKAWRALNLPTEISN
jgi:rhodanese-related sulfurtransferase